MMTIKKILVPVDLSEFSFEAIEPANSLASLYQAQIYLLHVIPIIPPQGYPIVDHQSETVLRDVEEASLNLLWVFVDKKFHNPKNMVRVIRRGQPHREIVKFAQDEGVDLIVMATHGKTGLARAVMGSVAEEVIRRSPVHILAVKPPSIQEKLLMANDVWEDLHVG